MKRGAVLLFTAALVALVMAVGIAERPTHAAAPFTVTSTGDEDDLDFPSGTFDGSSDGTCDVDSSTTGEQCTLRAAIQEANVTAGADTIEFDISTGGSVKTISANSALPIITDPVTINGYSQSGASPNTLATGNNAVLKIELSGPGAQSGVSGLKIVANDSTVKGLVVNNWDNGIWTFSNDSLDPVTNVRIEGNFMGTDATGTVTDPDGVSNNGDELGNNIGVPLTNARNNTIGGTTAAARNIISGNGIGISISGGTDNKIQGDYIGTNAAGDARLGNNQGVVLSNAPNNTIGGTTAAARNIISGNATWGVLISDAESTDNKVQGNYIGTDVTGKVTGPDGTPNSGDELGNGLNGVIIRTGASDNTIGGTKAVAGNIISGNGSSGSNPLVNTLSGVEVQFAISDDPKATGNRILSNSIYDNFKLGIDLYHTNNPPGSLPTNRRQIRTRTTARTTCRTSPSSPPPSLQPGE